jgi:hypothetical protein
MTTEEQTAALHEIGGGILAVAPAGWTELRYSLAMTAELSGDRLAVTFEDGRQTYVRPPEPPHNIFRELRAGMHQPGKGTWFSAEYVIIRPTRYSVDFDYDNEPVFSAGLNFKPVPMTYVNDLKWFPRDDEHIPDWLRQQIEEAGATEEE